MWQTLSGPGSSESLNAAERPNSSPCACGQQETSALAGAAVSAGGVIDSPRPSAIAHGAGAKMDSYPLDLRNAVGLWGMIDTHGGSALIRITDGSPQEVSADPDAWVAFDITD
jgi:hypothetical protein